MRAGTGYKAGVITPFLSENQNAPMSFWITSKFDAIYRITSSGRTTHEYEVHLNYISFPLVNNKLPDLKNL
jgi:hypothetical protein